MTELQLLDNNSLQLDDGSKDDQSKDRDSNFKDVILNPDAIDGILAGEPSAIKDGVFNSNEGISHSHY